MGFKAADVVKITGVKRTRLQQWLERGYIHPSIQVASGHGTRNIYNKIDLYNIAIFKKITESGFSRELASKFISMGVITAEQVDKHDTGAAMALFILFMRRDDEVKSRLMYYDKEDEVGVLDIRHLMGELKMEAFDDIYIINFPLIKDQIDQRIENYMLTG